ncbi:MAG: hypothetical protein A2X36_06550 [Elusimicrobia bacterium GWA2_69_24]|nr:MAG: hypothetical protein A2X36_06550 [Elusimicrobia bacterium GWA2_69_24]
MKTIISRVLLVLFAMSLFGAMSMSVALEDEDQSNTYRQGDIDGYDKGKSDGLSQSDDGSTSSGCCGSTNSSS